MNRHKVGEWGDLAEVMKYAKTWDESAETAAKTPMPAADPCKHAWGDEEGERLLDDFVSWRVCKECGKRRPTRTLSRGPKIEVWDMVNGLRYAVVYADQKESSRHLRCDCGHDVNVDFEIADNLHVVRKSAVTCGRCGAAFGIGSRGPDRRPRTPLWADSPDVE
jgi:hypothetical protein